MLTGKILSLVADKGFGFIKPAAGGDDLFFHCSAVDVLFSTLTVDQEVQYELDPSAEKPRAKTVKAGTGSSQRRPTPHAKGSYSRESRPAAPPRVAYEYGFVVKIHRRDMRGTISSVKGGPEYWFDSVDVIGDKKFLRLAMGEYVQFVPCKNADDPKKPQAKSVKATKRFNSPQENRLPRQARARGKKPTWRS